MIQVRNLSRWARKRGREYCNSYYSLNCCSKRQMLNSNSTSTLSTNVNLHLTLFHYVLHLDKAPNSMLLQLTKKILILWTKPRSVCRHRGEAMTATFSVTIKINPNSCSAHIPFPIWHKRPNRSLYSRTTLTVLWSFLIFQTGTPFRGAT